MSTTTLTIAIINGPRVRCWTHCNCIPSNKDQHFRSILLNNAIRWEWQMEITTASSMSVKSVFTHMHLHAYAYQHIHNDISISTMMIDNMNWNFKYTMFFLDFHARLTAHYKRNKNVMYIHRHVRFFFLQKKHNLNSYNWPMEWRWFYAEIEKITDSTFDYRSLRFIKMAFIPMHIFHSCITYGNHVKLFFFSYRAREQYLRKRYARIWCGKKVTNIEMCLLYSGSHK